MSDTAVEEATLDGGGRGELTERLRKEGWYLGEMTNDAADSILKTSAQPNTFLVYSSPETQALTLSARYQLEVEGQREDIVEHLDIHSTEEGNYTLTGQAEEHEDVVEIVNRYVSTREPPLRPALGKSFESQISSPDEPPDYSNASKALQPDIAPLPNISGITVEAAKEAQAGRISPGSSRRANARHNFHSGRPDYFDRSPWRRYENHTPCHPKNCCYACWYRPRYWTGYSASPEHKWYDLRGSGCLRILALLVFWLFCGLCFGCCKCCLFCLQLCFFLCCYDDDD